MKANQVYFLVTSLNFCQTYETHCDDTIMNYTSTWILTNIFPLLTSSARITVCDRQAVTIIRAKTKIEINENARKFNATDEPRCSTASREKFYLLQRDVARSHAGHRRYRDRQTAPVGTVKNTRKYETNHRLERGVSQCEHVELPWTRASVIPRMYFSTFQVLLVLNDPPDRDTAVDEFWG